MTTKTCLEWPQNLRRTKIRAAWFERFTRVDLGLDLNSLAAGLGTTYSIAQRWAQTFGYAIHDRRRECQVDWETVDWTRRDAALSRELAISRERVRQVRQSRNERPSDDVLACRLFEQFARRNTLALHGLPVAEAISSSGQVLKRSAAGRILRRVGVQPYRAQPRWGHLDWKLPNRDLAKIYAMDARQVASIRSRLGMGPAAWDVAGGRRINDPAYRQAVQAEERRSRQTPKTTGKAPIKLAAKMSPSSPAIIRHTTLAAAAAD